MVINYVVERSVDTVVNVESLSFSFTAFSAVNFSSNCCRTANKITTWFSYKTKLSRGLKLLFKCLYRGSYSGSNVKEGWQFTSVGTLVISGESSSDVNHSHGLHSNFIGRFEKVGGLL